MRSSPAAIRNVLFSAGLCLALRLSAAAGTTSFAFDGNRIYARLDFVRPNGSIHRALAFVDTDSPSMILKEALFRELQLDRDRPLRSRAGDFEIEVPRAVVVRDPSPTRSMGTDLKVEAVLAAGVLHKFGVVIAYGLRTLTLDRPASLASAGISVVGAVGASNMMMSGDGPEASGILVRIPEIALGALRLENVGVLGAAPVLPAC